MSQTPRFTVEIYHDLAPYLAGISAKEFFLDADKLIEAWKVTTEWTLDTFHGRLKPRTPTAAPNSYGHLICIGAPLNYSESAEPNISPAAASLDEAIERLEAVRGMDFTACPIFKQYAYLSARVKEVFPEAPHMAGLGLEGPITSAALYRGEGFYMDVMDEPEKAARCIALMTDSIVAFKRLLNRFCGEPEVSAGGAGLADDLASMLPHHMWDALVIPYWKRYYEGISTGRSRFLHCEALLPAQLPYLPKAGVTHYQPSVSPQLTLDDMRDRNSLPFDWLLYAYHITGMDDEELEKWIAKAVSYGPTNIRTQFGAYAVSIGKTDRIQAFLDIADKYKNN